MTILPAPLILGHFCLILYDFTHNVLMELISVDFGHEKRAIHDWLKNKA